MNKIDCASGKFQNYILFHQSPGAAAPDKKFPEPPQNRPAPKPWIINGTVCIIFGTGTYQKIEEGRILTKIWAN